MAEKSKVLVIGGTGESALSDPAKANIIEGFKSLGVNLFHGDMCDQGSLLNAIKQVDVVISAVGMKQLEDQDKIVAAIKAAGNVKMSLEVMYRVHAAEPAQAMFAIKAKIRRLVEAEGIPYTYPKPWALVQPWATAPPRDKVVILGDGNAKGYLGTRPPGCHIPKRCLTRRMTSAPIPSKPWMIQGP
ncbi:hypothetical protein BT93_E0277 [Corymbia citriodora subsp. variegata]|nr:hypothetical protein BT93_E0277 [Corymbia citriodora subsp. variegata]KAF8027320.1 hypothetical protein BT93_E0277 [Corymbia citriodora subsp. variegata]